MTDEPSETKLTNRETGWWVATFVIGMAALIIGVIAFAIAQDKNRVPASAFAAVAAPAGPATATTVDGNAKIDPQAMPHAPFTGRDPVLPPADSATVHEITLEATEVVMDVAPGVSQERWTFNNQSPGPVLRGKVGDTFKVTLVNKGKLGHSIDFHASQVAWDHDMRTIQPGQSLVYEFKATQAGAFMYHCGTAPALHHIGNGMYGAIIIDPPNLAPVEKEFVMMQSELYLGPQGQPGDLGKMLGDKWDAVVFNGYYNQYKFAPIKAETGKRYRVWVVDDGPSENTAFHVVVGFFAVGNADVSKLGNH